MDEQPRLTDLVPRHLLSYLLLLLAGLGMVAALELLYAAMPQMAAYTKHGRVAAFEIDSPGSLATWFSALTLELAAGAALVVYLVRRHRADDYHGVYPIWLWAALCWFLMSIDRSAQLHQAFQELMVRVTGVRVLCDGAIWWIVPYFFLLAGVGLRLAVDMRESPLCLILFTIVGGLGLFSLAVRLDWYLSGQGLQQQMAASAAELSADWLLLVTMLCHARHVIRDAQGLVPRREPKPKVVVKRPRTDLDKAAKPAKPRATSRPADDDEDDGDDSSTPERGIRSIDPPHTRPPTPAQKTVSAQAQSAGELLRGGLGCESTPQKLTKADKKALRKRLEEMRKQREGSS